MRLDNLSYIRPWFFDRNPGTFGAGYLGFNVAPHVTTQRWTGTVAAGYLWRFGFLSIHVLRETAPAPSGRITITLAVSGNMIIPAWFYLDNVHNEFHVAAPLDLVLKAGETLTVSTADASVGGTCSYLVYLPYTRFDV